MKRYGLIGYPLGHSFSKKYFSDKFEKENITNACYELFPLKDVQGLEILLKEHPDLCGLNVTIPYKEAVIPFLDEISDAAKDVGAVNTIRIEKGRLHGFNTDVYGFQHSLKPLLEGGKQEAIILGSGGAAKAVAFCLTKLEIPWKIVSRNPKKNQLSYQDLKSILPAVSLIVNTSPLGMHPDIETCPDIPYAELSEIQLLYDLVYNPEETSFLKKGKAQGCRIKNGLEMLYLQAEQAWAIWNA